MSFGDLITKLLSDTVKKNSPSPMHSGAVRPVPAKPDMDVPDNFTPYEGADMTCAEASAAGFEFVGADRYHGVDFWLSAYISNRRDSNEDILFVHKGPYNGAGIPGCAITGWLGSDKTVKIPRSINGRPVVKIETRAFFGNKEICEIYLPDSVIEIGDHAFFSCYSLKYARLSKNLAHIGEFAFSHCKDLEKVYLGGARVIDRAAFNHCERLTSVRLPKTVELLGSSCFAYTGLQKLYWDKIICSRERVLEGTLYIENNSVVLLGDCLQKCCLKNVDEIVIDDPAVRSIGVGCFAETTARKVTLSKNVRELQGVCFYTRSGGRIEEISGPGLRKFGNSCFSKNQEITISGMSGHAKYYWLNTDRLYIDENSFQHTPLERFYPGGSKDKPFVCVMVGDILARLEIRPNDGCCDDFLNALMLGGTTLTMNYNVKYSALSYIPTFGAKTLELCKELHSLRSFTSVEDFEEIVVRNPMIYARERSSFRPQKSVTLRFWFYTESDRKTTDSAFFLYVPHSENTEERRRLYELYDKCLGTTFDIALYDREIMNIVSSYRVRFTIAYMRIKGGYKLTPEARERYENFLLFHKRKAEFTAKKHGDTALLSLLEKLTEKNNDPKGDVQK